MATLRHQRSRGQLTAQGTPRLSPIASIVSSPSLSSDSSNEEQFNEDDLITPTAENVRGARPGLEYFSTLGRTSSYSRHDHHKSTPLDDRTWNGRQSLRQAKSSDSLGSQYSTASSNLSDNYAVQRNNKLRSVLLSRSKKPVDVAGRSSASASLSSTESAASDSDESLWGTPVDADAVAQGLVAPQSPNARQQLQKRHQAQRSMLGVSANTENNSSTDSSKSLSSDDMEWSVSSSLGYSSTGQEDTADVSTENTVTSISDSLMSAAQSPKQHQGPLVLARNMILSDTRLLIAKSVQKTCERCRHSQKGLWLWCWTKQLLCKMCLNEQAKRVPLDLKSALLDRSEEALKRPLVTVDLIILSRIANSLPNTVLKGLLPAHSSRLKARPAAADDSFMDLRARGASKHLIGALHKISDTGRYGSRLRHMIKRSPSHYLMGAASVNSTLAARQSGRFLLAQSSVDDLEKTPSTKRASILPYIVSTSIGKSSTRKDNHVASHLGRSVVRRPAGESSQRSPPRSEQSRKARSTDTFFSSDCELEAPYTYDHMPSGHHIRNQDHKSPTEPTSSELLAIDARFREASGVYVGMLGVDHRSSHMSGEGSLLDAAPGSQPRSAASMITYTYPDDVLICTGCSKDSSYDDDALILRSAMEEHVSWAHDSQLQRFIPLNYKDRITEGLARPAESTCQVDQWQGRTNYQKPGARDSNRLGLFCDENDANERDIDEDDPAMTYF
ncbi:unnamed protein product [Sympodiomycopsis kandeliae]